VRIETDFCYFKFGCWVLIPNVSIAVQNVLGSYPIGTYTSLILQQAHYFQCRFIGGFSIKHMDLRWRHSQDNLFLRQWVVHITDEVVVSIELDLLKNLMRYV
jgi:hypothetical protein